MHSHGVYWGQGRGRVVGMSTALDQYLFVSKSRIYTDSYIPAEVIVTWPGDPSSPVYIHFASFATRGLCCAPFLAVASSCRAHFVRTFVPAHSMLRASGGGLQYMGPLTCWVDLHLTISGQVRPG